MPSDGISLAVHALLTMSCTLNGYAVGDEASLS